MDQAQLEDNVTLEQALRRANLLSAAAKVSQNITQILDIDELLPKTVDIICEAYNFYYAGVFLIDDVGEFAVLRAGRGEPGRIMMENNHKLAVGGNSMIGACTARNEARISLDVDTEKVWYPNPVLPETRSEMALPLAIGGRVIGAVTVQSVEAAAFSEEDTSSLQAMANQLAIAIDNARQRRELEETHAALVQAQTFQAIATATGDAIHWIGNKAEPIGGTVERIRHDVKVFTVTVANLLTQATPNTDNPVARLLIKEAAALQQADPGLVADGDKLSSLPLDRLERRLSVHSILDDLQIIDDSARLIMRVKEDLIGPARELAPRPTMLGDVVKDAVSELSLPPGVLTVAAPAGLPLVLADPVQMNRVVVNLLKNAIEATEKQPQPQIVVSLSYNAAENLVEVAVADNGDGIPPEDINKIWITFHTTKGPKGHSGLGLPAAKLIMEQTGGSMAVASTLGQGSTFTFGVPAQNTPDAPRAESKGKGKILLVDDADTWRAFAGSALTKAGYSVSLAGDGYAAANPAQADLILVDDILAEGDSKAVLAALQQAGAIGKVVAVSSNPRVERTKERMLLGIRNFIPKPYTTAELLAAVKTALA
ncbi:MAG: hypothetical protein Kow0031_18380 [Anaerolineae bacterium]